MLSADDRLEIAETLALHAHIFDGNQLDRLDEIFTPTAVYDMSATGIGVFEGIDTIRAAAARMTAGGRSPRAHFLTNMVVTERDESTVSVQSRGLMIMADGSIPGRGPRRHPATPRRRVAHQSAGHLPGSHPRGRSPPRRRGRPVSSVLSPSTVDTKRRPS